MKTIKIAFTHYWSAYWPIIDCTLLYDIMGDYKHSLLHFFLCMIIQQALASSTWMSYSISQEICTRFLLCCALLLLYIDWFSHIHQAYIPGTLPTKQPWWIWINTSCEFIMKDCMTTTKQNTTKPGAYFLRYTVLYPTAESSYMAIPHPIWIL